MSIFFSFGQNCKSWVCLIQKNGGMNLKISFIHLIFLPVFFQVSQFLQKTSWAHLFGFTSKLPIASVQICTFQMISSISHRNFLFSLSFANGKCSLLNKKLQPPLNVVQELFSIETVFWSYRCKRVLDDSFWNSVGFCAFCFVQEQPFVHWFSVVKSAWSYKTSLFQF